MTAPNKLREKLAEAFLASLKEDKLPWRATWYTARPENAITGKRYNGINSLWLSFCAEAEGYADHRWCTYKQAESKGWHVKKGEHSSLVEYWRLYDKAQKKYVEQWEARRIIQADPEREKDIILSCRTYNVFNAKQIEGIPDLEIQTNVNIEDVRAKRDVLLANMGLKFSEGGNQAFYRPSTDQITMPRADFFVDTYGYMSTFLHECGHATGHQDRLNRDLSGSFGSPEYAKEELRAEISSAFTAQALGFGRSDGNLTEGLENHKAYIQSWIECIENKPNELFAAIKDAEKISDYLLDKGEFLKDIEREDSREEQEEKNPPSLDSRIKSAMITASQQVDQASMQIEHSR